MNNIISVIIPVYNVESYLRDCVESVINQTYRNIEIVLVDDGSKDHSGDICDELAAKNENIKVIHQSNGGLMAAWKNGVINSSGKYIGFVDSDDWIDTDMYARMLQKAETDQSDMVVCGLVKEYEDGRQEYEKNIISEGLYVDEQIKEKIYPVFFDGNNYSSRGITVNRVTKLYSRKILLPLLSELSNEVSIGEDLLTTFKYLINANRVSILGDFCPYHYRMNNESMVKKYSDSKYMAIDLLRSELLKTDSKGYDFIEQINTDYIKLSLIQLDDEILFSKKRYVSLRQNMRNRFGGLRFRKIIGKSQYRILPLKYRLYILFFKYKCWDVAILMRKIKR